MSGYGLRLPTSTLQGKRSPLVCISLGVFDSISPRYLHNSGQLLFRAVNHCRCREKTLLLKSRDKRLVLSALNSDADSIARGSVKKRAIVEHIYLLKAKSSLSEEEEKNMLDYLYTTQYQMRGILAISVGRIEEVNADGFTHAMYMRFQKKEDLESFYRNSGYLSVLNEYVIPYCYVRPNITLSLSNFLSISRRPLTLTFKDSVSVDFESEVEDDIIPIFRRGEEFNSGVEYVHLISVNENADEELVNETLTEFHNLVKKFSWIIVQSTIGAVFRENVGNYTQGAVIRFPSVEALESFRRCSDYEELWRKKLPVISRKAVAVHFPVDPVGSDVI